MKPYRDGLKPTALSARLQATWWQFYSQRKELQAGLAGRKRCLVNSQVSKHLVFAWQPVDRIFGHTLYAFTADASSFFAVVQSRVHEGWARLLSSSMKTDLRYAASDCFETFPFPQPDPRTVIDPLEALGEQLYETRAMFMVDTDQGLTKTYNALKDPDNEEPRILKLRRLHEHMDRAVLDAYGWTDVEVPPFCPLTEADHAALTEFEDEVIDRLYVLNAERAQEEERLGLRKKKRAKGKRVKKSVPRKASKSSDSDEQGKLF